VATRLSVGRAATWPLAVSAAVAVLSTAPPQARAEVSPTSASERLPLKPGRSVDFDVDEGTWISLAVSPDGKTILFELLGDLYAMPVAGGRATAITHGMAFNSQPAFSPDGARIAFVSDRSGGENVWTADRDGSDARQITHNQGPDEFVSPAWSSDGKTLFVSLYRSDKNAAELWRYAATGGDAGKELTGGAFSALGAVAAPDGRHLFYAAHTGPLFEDDVTLPLWSIHRRDLLTGREDTIVTNQGSAMRPVLSPDGRRLVYGARLEGRTAFGCATWRAAPIGG